MQCAEPQLNSFFCVDAETVRMTRRRLVESFAGTDVMVPNANPSVGYDRMTERGVVG
jgi:hypothetical protein